MSWTRQCSYETCYQITKADTCKHGTLFSKQWWCFDLSECTVNPWFGGLQFMALKKQIHWSRAVCLEWERMLECVIARCPFFWDISGGRSSGALHGEYAAARKQWDIALDTTFSTLMWIHSMPTDLFLHLNQCRIPACLTSCHSGVACLLVHTILVSSTSPCSFQHAVSSWHHP